MENATYIGLSYQAGLERQLNVTANNIANASTPGYKARHVLFESYMNEAKGAAAGPYYSTNDYGEMMDVGPGSYAQTGRPLDVALEGPGFMGVITGDGVKYTRAGSFSLNSVGEIVTPSGQRVADDGGAPITIPAGTKKIIISASGQVSADGNGVGQLMMREFANPQSELKPVGNSLYEASKEGLPAEETQMRQGMIEGSNVNGVAEMADMIETMRNYQSVQRMLQTESDRMRTAIQRLSGRNQ